ncbi:MAG: ABC transporter permease subunit [Halorientalis sp.]
MRDRQLQLIARKDFDEAVRSRRLVVMTAVLGLLALAGLYVKASREGVNAKALLAFLTYILAWIVPVVALVSGYMSVVGERRSGSIKLLLGQPFSRAEVLTGKIIGRSYVITAAIGIAFAVAGALLLALTSGFPFGTFLWLLFATVLLGVVYVCISVAVSTVASSRLRAMTLTVGLILLFQIAWSGLTMLLHAVLTLGSFPPTRAPQWYLFLRHLNPTTAYVRGVSLIFQGAIPYPGVTVDGVPVLRLLADPRLRYETPFYLSEGFMLFVLVGWIVAAGGLAYWRLRDADLG